MSSKANSVDSAAASPSGSFSGNDGVDSKIMVPKNVADVVMEHGVSTGGTFGGEEMIGCRYCDDYLGFRGVYEFLCHLAGTRTENDFEVCEGVGDDVRKEMLRIFSGLQESNEEGCDGIGEKRKGNEVDVGSSRDDLKRRRVGSQAIVVNNMVKKTLRGEASRSVARFFYNNAILLDVVKSDEFITMCELVSRYGLGFVPPSLDEIKGKYLTDEVKLTREALEEHRAIWKKKGCTIMVDGWTDPKRRNILNILVNGPKGTFFLKSVDASDMLESHNRLFKMMDDIVEEVGEENVVQIVTDNTTYYKVAGEMLMAKRTRLYWTPCATHTIEMILEDYEKIPIHEETITKAKRVIDFIYSRASLIPRLHNFTKGIDLMKQGITCCATSYLTLGYFHENKESLRKMFTSKEWKSSQFAKTRDGKYVEDVVLDTEFWENVIICFKSAHPLVEVLRLVSSIDEPATGFIYEAMEQAKEEIRRSLSKDVIESFMPLWEIINEKLDKQLHCPLHAAGYFLNPKFHYSPEFRDDIKVKHGLQNCITRMVADPKERAKIEIQLDDFDTRADLLGNPIAIMVAEKKIPSQWIPSQWWDSFGDGQPELKNFAIRVLSSRCSSYGGEHNQSVIEMDHTKRRNRLRQKIHNDLVFVSANSKLVDKKQS